MKLTKPIDKASSARPHSRTGLQRQAAQCPLHDALCNFLLNKRKKGFTYGTEMCNIQSPSYMVRRFFFPSALIIAYFRCKSKDVRDKSRRIAGRLRPYGSVLPAAR